MGVKATSLTKAATDAGLKLDAGNRSLNLLYSHQDQVVVPAPGTVILASTNSCPIAATSLGKHILTFQGHPEFFADYSRALYQFRRPAYPPETYAAAMASLDQDADQDWVAKLMIDFCLAPQ